MNECYGKKFILNGTIQLSDSFDNTLVYKGNSIYEVIRVSKGIPVFFNDHMERLATSIKLQKKELITDISAIRRDIVNLVRTEKRKEINLKIVFNYKEDTSNYLIYFIQPIYPSDEQYRKGVKGILYHAERNDPEAKVINHKLRSSVSNKLISEGGYEALLVNEQGGITEGSRSNIFFIKGDKLITAPDETILNGVTRKCLLTICREENIEVEFRCVPADSIAYYDAVFMTGTSPMVLPFNCIDNIIYNVQVPVIERLRKLYIEKVEESMLSFMMGN